MHTVMRAAVDFFFLLAALAVSLVPLPNKCLHFSFLRQCSERDEKIAGMSVTFPLFEVREIYVTACLQATCAGRPAACNGYRERIPPR